MADNNSNAACAAYCIDQPNVFNCIELFGELHFNENPNSALPLYLRPSSSSSSLVEKNPEPKIEEEKDKDTGIEKKGSQTVDTTETHEHSENLQPCTEQGLESKVFDAEESNNENKIDDDSKDHKMVDIPKPIPRMKQCNIGLSRGTNKNYPPPLSSFGKNGKPQYTFKHIREDGRLVIKMTKNPPQDYLHACRENGRLRIYLVKAEDQEDSAPGGEVADPAENQEQDLDEAINKGGEDASNEINL